MATKICSFRNCNNRSSIHTKITFFGFPLRDEEKCRLWIELSGCEAANLKNQFLCEEHFDIIYLSKTPRRTSLLQGAQPFPYQLIAKDEVNDIDYATQHVEEPLKLDVIEEVYYDEIESDTETELEVRLPEIHEPPPKQHSEVAPIYEAPKTSSDTSFRLCQQYKPMQQKKRMSSEDNQKQSSSALSRLVKKPKISTTTTSSREEQLIDAADSNDSHNSQSAQHPDTVGDAIIDNIKDVTEITTFIFKGEEYIQMPKRIYLEQRKQLDKNVKKYEQAIRAMKCVLNDLDL